MVLIAIIWSIFAAFSIGVGIEPAANWQRVVKTGFASTTRKLTLLTGGLVSFAVIFSSFYLFVASNAAVVLVAWILTFILTRLAIETLTRDNIYSENADAPAIQPPPPVPAKKAPFIEITIERDPPRKKVKKKKAAAPELGEAPEKEPKKAKKKKSGNAAPAKLPRSVVRALSAPEAAPAGAAPRRRGKAVEPSDPDTITVGHTKGRRNSRNVYEELFKKVNADVGGDAERKDS